MSRAHASISISPSCVLSFLRISHPYSSSGHACQVPLVILCHQCLLYKAPNIQRSKVLQEEALSQGPHWMWATIRVAFHQRLLGHRGLQLGLPCQLQLQGGHAGGPVGDLRARPAAGRERLWEGGAGAQRQQRSPSIQWGARGRTSIYVITSENRLKLQTSTWFLGYLACWG